MKRYFREGSDMRIRAVPAHDARPNSLVDCECDDIHIQEGQTWFKMVGWDAGKEIF